MLGTSPHSVLPSFTLCPQHAPALPPRYTPLTHTHVRHLRHNKTTTPSSACFLTAHTPPRTCKKQHNVAHREYTCIVSAAHSLVCAKPGWIAHQWTAPPHVVTHCVNLPSPQHTYICSPHPCLSHTTPRCATWPTSSAQRTGLPAQWACWQATPPQSLLNTSPQLNMPHSRNKSQIAM